MAPRQEDRHSQDKKASNKNADTQQRKSTNEEKFTWSPEDVKLHNSVDEIPGFQPFPMKEKSEVGSAEPGKKKTKTHPK